MHANAWHMHIVSSGASAGLGQYVPDMAALIAGAFPNGCRELFRALPRSIFNCDDSLTVITQSILLLWCAFPYSISVVARGRLFAEDTLDCHTLPHLNVVGQQQRSYRKRCAHNLPAHPQLLSAGRHPF